MRSGYLSFPLVDWTLVGGASLAALAFFAVAPDALAPRVAQFLVLYLVWAGNAPHFAATNYRLYRSRQTIAQYPFTAFVVPLLVAAGVAASLAYPARLAPYFIKLYLFWSPYHYSGQAVGMTVLYARRFDITLSRPARRWLAVFIFGAFVTALAKSESQAATQSFFGITYPTLGLPVGLASAGLAVTLLAALGWFISLRGAAKKSGRAVPAILWLPGIAHAIWFLLGTRQPTFFALVPFFHGVQYLLVAGHLQLAERGRVAEAWPRWRTAAELSLWGVAIVAGGVLLLGILPRSIAQVDGRDPLFIIPIVIAAVQIHHFFVDGVIWKLHRAGLSRLLVGSAPVPVPERVAA